MQTTPSHDGAYSGKRAALLTQHRKELVIAPVLEPVRGCRIEPVTDYDTDLLGTFTRDIPRAERVHLGSATRYAAAAIRMLEEVNHV